jgi:hypothetical protein
MDRDSLRSSIVAGRARLDATLAGYDDEAMLDQLDAEWTRKDVLAHLAAWERRVVELLTALRRGETTIGVTDTDALNAEFLARDRDLPLRDVRVGERAAYEAMLGAIDGATDEELFDGRHFAWTKGDPFANWFRENGDEHFDEHLEQLTRPARTPG